MAATTITPATLDAWAEQYGAEYVAAIRPAIAQAGERLVLDRAHPAFVKTPRVGVAPVPVKCWPWAARVVRALAIPGEVGVGDTARRIAGAAGGEAYKRWYRRIMGRACGCSDRQRRLNERFPY